MIASPFVLVLRRANTSQSHHQAVETKALSFMSAHHQQQNHNKTPRSLSIKKEVNITYSTQLVLISLYNGHYYYYHYLWHGVNGTNIDGTYFNLLILVIIIIAVIVHYYCYSAGIWPPQPIYNGRHHCQLHSWHWIPWKPQPMNPLLFALQTRFKPKLPPQFSLRFCNLMSFIMRTCILNLVRNFCLDFVWCNNLMFYFQLDNHSNSPEEF